MGPRSRVAIGLAAFIGIGLLVFVIITGRAASLDAGVAPASTSSVIEPADAQPLPVVGPSESVVKDVDDPSKAQGTSTSQVPDESLIQVPRGEGGVTAPGLLAGSELGDVPTTAVGYRFIDDGLNRAALVAALARKFGIEGRPTRTDDDAWVVRPTGSLLPRVRVDPGPMANWEFDSMAQPVSSQPGSPSADASRSVDGRAAEEVTKAFLASLGVPIDELDWQVEASGGRTVVTGWQVFAGQRTQAGWRITFTIDGQIVQASGFAATAVEVPDLPVLGATTALIRARLPQWSALGPTLLTAAPAPASATVPGDGPNPAASGPAAALDERLITSAELGLAQFSQPDGRLLILPTYVLSAGDGSTWSLVAVADEALSLVSR